uniref:HPr family phosphocarrier protein n=1 Tax=Pararhizobium sp. IMCC3301 TaxID=3067904 RepID=UPI002741A4B7|nr:HPr family phosphocarrier protein [Pararhizobium sp. IMCC3301]
MTIDGAARTVTILNAKGLHARASAKFVKCAAAFDAKVLVSKGGQTVGGTSIMGLMMLGAAPGSVVELSATGPDSAVVLNALEALIRGRFGED